MKKFLLVLVVILLVAGCSKSTGTAQEKKFRKVAIEYYEKELKGKVVGINEYTVTLKNLKDRNYDVSEIVNQKECDETSNVTIDVTGKSYETSVNLICK